jgi:hypothetical protein
MNFSYTSHCCPQVLIMSGQGDGMIMKILRLKRKVMPLSEKAEVLGEWDNGMSTLLRSDAIMVNTGKLRNDQGKC